MREIQMVDLKGQYIDIQEEVDSAVIGVINSTQYINGPEVKHFQAELQDYLGVKHVVPCANGTDALQVAMMAFDLKPGDEVITSDFTFAATVEVIGLLGLTPVLVDVDPETFNMDPEAVRKAITSNTKVIVPVHLFGQSANMDAMMAIAEEHNLFVVEDNAQAIGSKYTGADGVTKMAGSIGHIGTTSFFPSKNLGCYGDGGAIFTNDDALAEKMRSIVNHGMGERYYYERYGCNSRLDSIQAAILRIKLRKLDHYIGARQEAARKYTQGLSECSNLTPPVIADYSTHVFHQYTVVADQVDQFKLQDYMREKGIPCMIYYPVPLHSQNAYKQVFTKHENFPVTNALCKTVFSLPMHTELDDEQIDYIIDAVKTFFKS